MEHYGKPWAEHSPRSYKGAISSTAAMAEGLDRDIELLEIQEVSAWRQQLGAATAGLLTAGPIGLIASLIALRLIPNSAQSSGSVGSPSRPAKSPRTIRWPSSSTTSSGRDRRRSGALRWEDEIFCIWNESIT